MAQLALRDVRGLLADLNDKLSGENDSEWHSGLKKFLRKENPWEVPTKLKLELKIWKTVTLGQYGSPKAYRYFLESSGIRIDNYAGQILEKTTISQTLVEVDLVLITVAELGFKQATRRDTIYARALELGLQLCPAEVGPALRLVYEEDSLVLVGMEPITSVGGYLGVFDLLAENGDRWLHGNYGFPESTWLPERHWAFQLPRK